MNSDVVKFKASLSQIFNVAESELTNDFNIKELNLTSAQTFMIAATMEDLSGEVISYKKCRNCTTVGELIELLESLY